MSHIKLGLCLVLAEADSGLDSARRCPEIGQWATDGPGVDVVMGKETGAVGIFFLKCYLHTSLPPLPEAKRDPSVPVFREVIFRESSHLNKLTLSHP